MSQQAREVKRRIKSVDNTRQITRTMEMVATAKLRRATDRVYAARPYAQALETIVRSLYAPRLSERYPLLRQPEAIRSAAILLLTANRGLCGGFNANLIRETRDLRQRLEDEGLSTELHLSGKKGISYFKFQGVQMESTRTDIGDEPTVEDAESLPIEPEEGAESADLFLLSPSGDMILERLLPLYVRNQVYRALVENAAAEQGARRTAMKNATDNAEEMLENLRRSYNRARQAQITQELAEIVGGAEAL